MAILSMSWSASTSSTNRNTPKMLKPVGISQTSSMPTTNTMNKWSITTTDQLNQFYNPSKLNESLSRNITTTVYLEEENDVKHARLVKRVRQLISKVKDDRFEGLIMVDALQRLGIDYHFEEEINLILQRHYLQFTDTNVHEYQSLYEVSLCFRILRQEGFYVSADAFTKFKGNNGKFEENLRKDIRGLMELYEASQLSIEGESVLDEAAKFSYHLLDEMMTDLDDYQARRMRCRLESSYQKSLPIFNIKNSIKDFNGTILQELAELDFIRVRSIRQMELNHILRWWKDLGLAQELDLARDQPLKWYIWPMVALQNPNLSKQRVDLTKAISLIYVIDDLFDIYGTLDELTLFTEAVKRWDVNVVEWLPCYMKASFKALYDITNDIACNIYEQHGFNPIKSLRKSWETLCDAFLVEAKWFASGYLPKAEEYLKNGIVSSGVPVVLTHMFFLLEDGTTNEYTNLIDNSHGIVTSVAKILRLWDDLGSAEDEDQDGHDGSYIKCYMKEHEHERCSINLARDNVVNMISDTWKHLNKEYLLSNPFLATFRKGSVNIARIVPLMYSYDGSGSLPLLEDHIKSALCDGFDHRD